jgi:hypothetical protein
MQTSVPLLNPPHDAQCSQSFTFTSCHSALFSEVQCRSSAYTLNSTLTQNVLHRKHMSAVPAFEVNPRRCWKQNDEKLPVVATNCKSLPQSMYAVSLTTHGLKKTNLFNTAKLACFCYDQYRRIMCFPSTTNSGFKETRELPQTTYTCQPLVLGSWYRLSLVC